MLLLLLHGSSELVALDLFCSLFLSRLAFGIADSSEFGLVGGG
jgi:hypothetical protein